MKLTVTSPIIHPIIVPTTSTLKTYNFYLVKNKDAIFLVDAGVDTEECWNYFQQILHEAEIELHDLDAIILTHNHTDHIGLVNKIRSLIDIPVYAHPNALVRLKREPSFLKARVAFYQTLYEQMGCSEEGEKQIDR